MHSDLLLFSLLRGAIPPKRNIVKPHTEGKKRGKERWTRFVCKVCVATTSSIFSIFYCAAAVSSLRSNGGCVSSAAT